MTAPVMPTAVAWELPAAACTGALVGWLVNRVVTRLLEPLAEPVAGRWPSAGTVVAASAAAAMGLWWWEIVMRGQVPIQAPEVTRAALAWRWAGHVVFLGFLAAAAWIDLRERVIPDAITVPGVLVGLAWAGLRPGSLPPVARAVPRSFATPVFEPDVLGFSGPLGGEALPAWLGGAPAAAGLAVAAALFLGWWAGCTAAAEPTPHGDRPFDLRPAVLAAGIVGVFAAWWRGGAHWVGLLSALVGTAAGVVVVWATRIGASRALGREALGFGDVTLIAVIGAWLGWQGTLIACCLGVLFGLAHGLTQFVRSRDHELPFGPSLCVGAAVVVVLWRPIWERCGPVFERPGEIAAVAGGVIVLTALTLAAWWRLRGGAAD